MMPKAPQFFVGPAQSIFILSPNSAWSASVAARTADLFARVRLKVDREPVAIAVLDELKICENLENLGKSGVKNLKIWGQV